MGVETGVGVGRSRPFWPQSERELKSVKFGRLWPGVAGYHPAAYNDFVRTIVHPPENIEKREVKESGSV